MSGTKSIARLGSLKKDDSRSSRSVSRVTALEKGKKSNPTKETNSAKSCKNCLDKSDNNKSSKASQNNKLAVKKANMKCAVKDAKKKTMSANHHQKVVIVSKRSSSVSVVKSCKLRKSVSVKKVSYSTSVVLSSEEEDSDSEDESEEEEKRECLKKKKTIMKRTTSKMKANGKKVKNKLTTKDKAIKMLCEKLSSGGKQKGSRELRPRFPYNSLQEWPTARTHRMASLNALAKVHVLYENEGRVVGENMQEADETTLMDFLNENSDEDIDIKKEFKPLVSSNQKKNEKVKAPEEKLKNVKKDNNSKKDNDLKKEALSAQTKIRRRGKKRKLPDVEIIDTKICKRMASLNAQAILAASYQFEPKLKRSYKKSDKCYSSSDTETEVDLSIIKKEKEDCDYEVNLKSSLKKNEKGKTEDIKETFKEESNKHTESSTPKVTKLDTANKRNKTESEVTIIESATSAATVSNRSCTVASTAATTKVGMTQYTEVTKVQINTHKDSEVKEERKSERKIEHIVSNEDVAITQMYHYQSKTANESYCVQMQTTYKPSSKTPSATNMPPRSEMRPFVNEGKLPDTSSFYGQSSMLPSQVYPNMGPVPTAGMERRLPRHCGASAFSVPRFKHSQQMQFPSNEYGYYQPAGPLIQPVQDQVIHKPVPYHPQPNRHQTPQRPQPSSYNEGFQSFESRHLNQDKPLQPSTQQKSLVPVQECSESQPQPQTPPQASRPQEESRSRNVGTNPSPSFQQPPKHVRSPVMPTLYSSQQNFRGYQTQKREPNSFANYGQSYERKDTGPKLVGYESRKSMSSTSKSSAHDIPGSSFKPSKDIPHQSSNIHSGGQFKDVNDITSPKQKIWDFKTTHSAATGYNQEPSSSLRNKGTSNAATSSSMHYPATSNMFNSGNSPHSGTSANFLPYNNFRKDSHQSSNLNEVHFPQRPPSVITIDEDCPRDTKTYIQLEVPKNSHREKIVVVDVEDDEIEEKEISTKASNLPSAPFDKFRNKRDKKNIELNAAPNPVFNSPQDKYSYTKSSETSKAISSGPSNSVERKSQATSTRPQNKLEKKQMLKNSDISNTFDRSQDKIETKQTHSRSSDISKTTFDRPQDKIERDPIHSKTSDMHKTTFERTQDKIEKKQLYLKDSDMAKTYFDRNNDELEKKLLHPKHNDVSKTTFDRPQDKIKKKDNRSSVSGGPKPTVDNPQDKIEKHSRYSDSSKKTIDRIQHKHDYSRNSDMPKATFDKPQEKMEKKHSKNSDIPKATFYEPHRSTVSENKNDNPFSCGESHSNFNIAHEQLVPDISIVKVEKISPEDEQGMNNVVKDIQTESKCDDAKTEAQDVMSIEAKKKKESAVVRRAKMNGKQRTFRDCYNRPLAQKKKDDISKLHLSKDFQPLVSLPRLVLPKLEKPPAHGWSWEGTPCEKLVYITSKDPPCLRRCYPSIRHVEGDVISVRDCVFLRSGPRKTDVPFVAKVTALWEMPTNGEMTMSLFWYYRPEHTEYYKKIHTAQDEILASKHRDINSVACIEDKCFVLTYSEYCRYRKRLRILEDSTATLSSPVPEAEEYDRRCQLPPLNVSPDLVLFCRRVYDHDNKKLHKNPT